MAAGTVGVVRRSKNAQKHHKRRAANMVDVRRADIVSSGRDGNETTIEMRFEGDERGSILTPLLAKELGAGGGNEDLSANADVGGGGGLVMGRVAVMVGASTHVGGDETTAIVTVTGRMVEDGEGAGGESAVALLTDAGDLTTCGGDGVGVGEGGGKKKRRTGQKQKYCIIYRQTGSCDKGDNCPFRHGNP